MADTSILEKIKKLLALATSSNPNEAALAAQRAQELMVKYAVEESQLAGSEHVKEEIGRAILGTPYKNVSKWKALLARALSPAFFCRAFFIAKVGIVIIGRPTDREALKATFNCLEHDIEKMAAAAWAKASAEYPGHGKSWKNAFYYGVCQTIKDRISVNTKALSTGSTAIVLANRQKEVDEYVDQHHKLTKAAPISISSHGYTAGQVAGHALNLGARATKALGA